MNKISFNTQKRELGLNTTPKIKKYLLGKEIIILNTLHGHNYGNTGDIVKIESGTFNSTSLTSGISGGNHLKYTQFSVITKIDKNSLQNHIKELQSKKKEIDSEIKDTKNKLEFLKITNSEVYDENEFKAFHTLSLVENTELSKIEKARLIAQLIK